jgi:iron(III) transport system permease protein
MRRSPLAWTGYGLLWAVLIVGGALPVATVLAGGISPFYLGEALRHPVYREGLANAFTVACTVTILCFAIALPLAWIAWRFRFRGSGLAEALLLAPLVLPPFVGSLGVFQLLGTYGVLNTLGAHLGLWSAGHGPDWLGDHRLAVICLVEAFSLYPMLYLTLSASFSRLDGSLIEAAAAMGAGRLTTFRRVVAPLLKPGLFAGGSVIFVWAFTELGTPLLLGFDRITSVQVFYGLNDIQVDNRLPLALVVVMLVVASACYGGGRLLAGRASEALVVKGQSGSGIVRLRGWKAALAWSPFAATVLVAAAPHLTVVLMASARDWYGTLLPSGVTAGHFRDALGHPDVINGIFNSLLYSTLATAVAVALGLAIAWIAVRWKPPGAAALDALAMAPLAVPGLIMAFGYLALGVTLGRLVPALKPVVDPLQNPLLLLVIAYAVRRLPNALRATHAGLSQAPLVLEEAAAACGAGPLLRLRRITIPLIAGALAAGAIMTFSASMLEVSDSLILAQKRAYWPITRVIYDLVAVIGPGPAIACAFATWAMAFLTASLAAAAVFLGRSPSGLFRD